MFKVLPMEKIYSKSNVRKENDEFILELMKDIEKNGLLQPIVVRADDNGKYEIVAGHRRFLACRNLGIDQIETNILEDVSDKHRLLLQLSENIQRKQMSAYEMAEVFKQMKEEFKCNDIQLSRLLNKSPNFVSDTFYAVRLLEREFGGNIPEDKKKMSRGTIKAMYSKRKSGASTTYHCNGFTYTQRGHNYMISSGSYEFEEALNRFLKEWNDKLGV